MSGTVRIYRWIVFLLAAGYCIRTLVFGDFGPFGGPFRFLTIWALFGSFFAASRMMAMVEGRSDKRWDGYVGMITVINAMVVFMYWRLFLADPTSVTSDGELGAFYLEMYLHGLGPLLQAIDAVFIHKSFRKIRASLLWLFGVIGVYIAWSELVVGPLNSSPTGSVTSGLPYPFLNSLEFGDRAIFYAANFAIAIVFLLAFAGLTWIVRRQSRSPVAI